MFIRKTPYHIVINMEWCRLLSWKLHYNWWHLILLRPSFIAFKPTGNKNQDEIYAHFYSDNPWIRQIARQWLNSRDIWNNNTTTFQTVRIPVFRECLGNIREPQIEKSHAKWIRVDIYDSSLLCCSLSDGHLLELHFPIFLF